jgi:hypothetical protein
VICGKEKDSFNYLIGWLANIFQNVLFLFIFSVYLFGKVGKRNETCVVLLGEEGVGKNCFTNTICELTSGYSESNISQIGKFNEILRGKVILVLNEKENERKKGGKLWSLITENTIGLFFIFLLIYFFFYRN